MILLIVHNTENEENMVQFKQQKYVSMDRFDLTALLILFLLSLGRIVRWTQFDWVAQKLSACSRPDQNVMNRRHVACFQFDRWMVAMWLGFYFMDGRHVTWPLMISLRVAGKSIS